MNTVLDTLIMGPFEVPTAPWQVFEATVSVPASAMENGEKYLFIGVKRVTATGKTAPTNHPNVLRYCKKYWERIQS